VAAAVYRVTFVNVGRKKTSRAGEKQLEYVSIKNLSQI
jgi:hypothetical protein